MQSETDSDSDSETELRSVLAGHPLTDEEVEFLHQALMRSGTEYTSDGLRTFAEWDLHANVTLDADGRWSILVAGPRVNAEWTLYVDPTTGAVEEGPVFTEEPAPDFAP